MPTNSDFFKLNLNDVAKGAVMAIIAAVLTYFSNPTLDFTMIDWNYVIHVAITAFAAYMAKNFLSTDDGKFMGKI
jgi:hypothetical protein